jgi:sodium/bile acid cotransporter 7
LLSYKRHLVQVILLGIAWNAFCNAFSSGLGLDLRQSLVLVTLLPILHLASLAGLFKIFSLSIFGFTRGETVAAMFCSSRKTLAFGLPLINTIFEGNANLAAYCAPLMFIHPLQMTLGSLLIPAVSKYTKDETSK